jgi:hypothetical protein
MEFSEARADPDGLRPAPGASSSRRPLRGSSSIPPRGQPSHDLRWYQPRSVADALRSTALPRLPPASGCHGSPPPGPHRPSRSPARRSCRDSPSPAYRRSRRGVVGVCEGPELTASSPSSRVCRGWTRAAGFRIRSDLERSVRHPQPAGAARFHGMAFTTSDSVVGRKGCYRQLSVSAARLIRLWTMPHAA